MLCIPCVVCSACNSVAYLSESLAQLSDTVSLQSCHALLQGRLLPLQTSPPRLHKDNIGLGVEGYRAESQMNPSIF